MEVLTSNSTYFSISEPKAKLMTRYSREMTLINSDSSDLTKKKVTRLVCFFVIYVNQPKSITHHTMDFQFFFRNDFERNLSGF
jgi:hypothetical protein